jgi:hypothetical protein
VECSFFFPTPLVRQSLVAHQPLSRVKHILDDRPRLFLLLRL